MCADEADKSPLAFIIEFHDQPVIIAPDVENHPIICNDTGSCKSLFDVIRTSPVSTPGDIVPRFEVLFAVRVFFPKLFERAFGDYSFQVMCFE